MYKYFVFENEFSYHRIINNDLIENPDVYYFDGPKNKIFNFFYKFHFTDRINSYIKLPFKGVWYSFVLPNKKEFEQKKQFFIFAETSYLTYCIPFLKRLRKEYPTGKLIYTFSNPPTEEMNLRKLAMVRQYFDIICTFDESFREDDWVVKRGAYSKVQIYNNHAPESDMFFVGAAKDRLDFLIRIYDKMTGIGLKCIFYITGVSADKIQERPNIIYNRAINYMDVLRYVEKTKCILELIQMGYFYASIRTFEAIAYEKKLITNNQKLSENQYYDSSNMYSILSADEIQREWFDRPLKPYDIDISVFSPNRFLEFLSEGAQL